MDSGGTPRAPRAGRQGFLNHLVLDRKLSASSQNQALNAVVFLYRHVLGQELGTDHLGAGASQHA